VASRGAWAVTARDAQLAAEEERLADEGGGCGSGGDGEDHGLQGRSGVAGPALSQVVTSELERGRERIDRVQAS
jgi:hypothetical protein